MEQAAVLSIGLDPATIREVKRHSGWFITLGVALIVLGVIALGAVGLVTLASVLLFGWLLVIGGIMHSVHAFSAFTRGAASRAISWAASSAGDPREVEGGGVIRSGNCPENPARYRDPADLLRCLDSRAS